MGFLSVLASVFATEDTRRRARHTYAQTAARALVETRDAKLQLIHGVITGLWTDYLTKPSKMPADVWAAITKRFTPCNLALPVLNTIVSATYGGKVTRRIKESITPAEEIEAFMLEAGYAQAVVRGYSDATAYGTAYMVPGRDASGRATIATLPPVLTDIATPEDDVAQVDAVTVAYAGFLRQYRDDGVYRDDGKGWMYEAEPVPVVIGRGRYLDATTPYGDSLIYPAVLETVQTTFLQNDIMVLGKQQSFATLVMIGETDEAPEETGWGPFTVLRGGEGFDAKYISPEAKIDSLNAVVDTKYERVAAQCSVPISLFKQTKAGASETTGAALLTHKPLFDLVRQQQEAWKETERRLVAAVDAYLMAEQYGASDYREVLDGVKVEIEFEHESNPQMNLADAQTTLALLDRGLVSFEKAYLRYNPDATEEEARAAEPAPVEAGFGEPVVTAAG